ncbi:hypothetical protein BU16DRAFT_539141 [Lophium mytilinum]|uniref:Clock-controlled protein 6 n=1 Tax=Lophium mytilinum TaxID=390894 RepID=A0A6A6QSN3_9PEZI|nr:hypothetical protein BU16DRAFT_539141 [Lophium mytilinum]
MRFSSTVAATAALVAGVSANYGYGNFTASPVSYVTETYVDYTTVCPEATTLTIGESTYTVTEATTLTITACSCTLTKPVYTSLVTSCSTSAASAAPPAVYTSVAPASSPAPYYPIGTGSTPAYTPKPTGTGAYTAPIATFTGAAGQVGAASGAGLAALFGLVAYVLPIMDGQFLGIRLLSRSMTTGFLS